MRLTPYYSRYGLWLLLGVPLVSLLFLSGVAFACESSELGQGAHMTV